MNEEDYAKKVENNIYTKEFYSLMPVATESNEQAQMERHLAKLQEKSKKFATAKGKLVSKADYDSSLESLEDIFGEELFASLINQEGEIQVGEKIYKYTDVGLFIVNEEEIGNLYAYLDKKGISKNFVEDTPISIKELYISNARGMERSKNSNAKEIPLEETCEQVLRLFADDEVGLNSAEYYLADSCGGVEPQGEQEELQEGVKLLRKLILF